jgi:Family of unknown function (DUF6069)
MADMTAPYSANPAPRRPGAQLDAGRLWAGGVATALVVALIAVAGIVVIRGIFEIAVLAPKGDGVWGDASTAWYVLSAGAGALIATGLMHLFISFTPRPVRFFGWVIFLATAIAVAAPLAVEAETSAKLATATLNLILGVAIGSLVAGTARSAMRTPGSATPGAYRWPSAG